MKLGVTTLGTIGLLALSSGALAKTPPPRTGFQMAIRTGYSVPFGKVRTGANMSDTVSGQVPILLDIGGKLIPELFLGGYLGLAFGGAAGTSKDLCPNCTAAALHLGIEAQYHFLPRGSVNPWLGYGLGFESLALADDASIGWGGFQFARLMAGVDFRINRIFGVGPFADLAMGTYSKQNTEIRGVTINEDIGETAMHQWLTFGVRFVFFP